MANAHMNTLQALTRDGGRSISGQFDWSIPTSGPIALTNAAHIIPFSVNSSQSNTDKVCTPFPTVAHLALIALTMF